ncbi:MAG: hypothetical protein CMG35_04765 [Candidatus Marinimicrobia bacterium]|jgi:hypothetical protein|nr:hypothetical protein [Candidatus Neomarinimicrobiota bacterium]|tara:strand:- start:381 stop:983 length:603 start_codon:yes stop_codon:yes gene_type:complete
MVLMYTPIDLPEMKVDRDEFIKWHESKRKRNQDNIAYSTKDFIAPWLVSFAFHKDYGWCNRFLKVIPNFQDILYNHLPYNDVVYVNFLEQKIPCQLHQDVGSRPDKEDEPGSYKAFMVYDKPLMYFQEKRDVEDKIYINHPNHLTKWFAINNYDALHAADLPKSPDRKIIMTILGKLNKEKHQEILKRSLEKYKDYTISF